MLPVVARGAASRSHALIAEIGTAEAAEIIYPVGVMCKGRRTTAATVALQGLRVPLRCAHIILLHLKGPPPSVGRAIGGTSAASRSLRALPVSIPQDSSVSASTNAVRHPQSSRSGFRRLLGCVARDQLPAVECAAVYAEWVSLVSCAHVFLLPMLTPRKPPGANAGWLGAGVVRFPSTPLPLLESVVVVPVVREGGFRGLD